MAVIEPLDFVGVPTDGPERSRVLYRGVSRVRPAEPCFGITEPETQNMLFVAQKDNVAAVLEANGGQLFGDTRMIRG